MSYDNIVTEENYNPEQNYYFVDYTLIKDGHPEYIEECRKKDPSFTVKTGVYQDGKRPPKWVRKPFSTEQDVQEIMNFLFSPYPHRVEHVNIRTEEELNEIVMVIDDKTKTRLNPLSEGYEKGRKVTQRELTYGRNYQINYERVTGNLTDNGDSK